jgi:hypothetical protein
LSGRTEAGFSQTNPEKFGVLASGEEALKERGLLPGGEGRGADPEKSAQLDQEVHRLPRRDPQKVQKLRLLAKREEGIRSQEPGDRRKKA